jgi:anti-sigma factor RsiW
MKVVRFGEASCEKVRGYLDSYLSNELLVETNHEVLRHLEGCPQCAAELNTRARVRAQLQAAVRGTPAPAGLEGRIQRAVRAQRSHKPVGLYVLAAAAVVILCLAVGNLVRVKMHPEEAILQKASGRLAAVLNVGLRDHLHCAVFRKYSRQPETVERMASQLGPEFAGLAPLVKAKLPADFRIIQGHRCRAGGRQYVHFIAAGGGKLLSLILTRKQPGEALSGGIYQEGVDRYQVVGFESHDYLVYVISDLDAQQNLQLAASLAPAVRDYLAAHRG